MLDTRKMISDVNGEIARLTKIRDLLMTENGTDSGILLRIGGTTAAESKAVDKSPPSKRKNRLSAAGRAAIGAAARKRWAAAKKKGLQMNGQPLSSAKKKAMKARKSKRQPAPVA